MSNSTLRLAGIGALAGLLAGLFVAIPATQWRTQWCLRSISPRYCSWQKATCCGQVLLFGGD